MNRELFGSGTRERSEPRAWIGEEDDLTQRRKAAKGRGGMEVRRMNYEG